MHASKLLCRRTAAFSLRERVLFRLYSNKEKRSPLLTVIPDSQLRVAIVGRPNVGKSTLFNRLVGGYHAIVDSFPGVTRDCQEKRANLIGLDFSVIDTPGAESTEKILKQSDAALRTADLAVFVSDVKDGIGDLDEKIAKYVLAKNIPAIHVVNKCDNMDTDDQLIQAQERVGFLGRPIPISAEQNFGLDVLYRAIQPFYIGHNASKDKAQSEETESMETSDAPSGTQPIRLAIIGRTNVGKSTLLNRLIGEERVTVSEEPGTTRDAVELKCVYKDRTIMLADTAGIRKKKYMTNRVESESLKDTLRTIKYANIVALLIDSQQPFTREDLSIASMIEKEGRAIVIAANKWDTITEPYVVAQQIESRVARSLSQLRGVPVVVCSALSGRNVPLLMDKCVEMFDRWSSRISTGKLNRFLEKLTRTLQLPASFPKIQYITQVGTRPPKFAFFFTRAKELPAQFERQIVNAIREEFNLYGMPIRIIQRKWNRDIRGADRKQRSSAPSTGSKRLSRKPVGGKFGLRTKTRK